MAIKDNALKLAKELDFSTAEELYEYIHASKINGNYKQAIDLYNQLTHHEKIACRARLKELLHSELYYEFLEFIANESE